MDKLSGGRLLGRASDPVLEGKELEQLLQARAIDVALAFDHLGQAADASAMALNYAAGHFLGLRGAADDGLNNPVIEPIAS